MATASVTVLLNRTCPPSLPILPNSFSLQADATDGEAFLSALVASLSGSIDDYTVQPRKDNTINVAAKLSYLERFREQTKQTKSITEKLDETTNTFTKKLTEVEDKLTEVEDKLTKVKDKLAEVKKALSHILNRLSRTHLTYCRVINYTRSLAKVCFLLSICEATPLIIMISCPA
jgi:septal ring factor EnvC (AmiA/AmiB activator)